MKKEESSKSGCQLRVAVVGRGNVGTHLVKALTPLAIVESFDSRRASEIKCEFDYILIAVSDRAIHDVAAALPKSDAVVAHTSGSIPLEALQPFQSKIGVFYPLQTFSKEKTMDYSEIPFFMEGIDDETTEKLRELALKISPSVYLADSEQRKKLHLASVFACNFVNYLYSNAWQIMDDAGLPTEVLIPLIHETAEKVSRINPKDGQTGPAARKDLPVIHSHLAMLENDSHKAQIYRLLTEGIMNLKE